MREIYSDNGDACHQAGPAGLNFGNRTAAEILAGDGAAELIPTSFEKVAHLR